jgi:hypothetical protein
MPSHTPEPVAVDIDLDANGALTEVHYPLGGAAQLWDEIHPAQYTLAVNLDAIVDGTHYPDRQTTTFGLREVHGACTQLVINGRPIFLRGTLEYCIFH